MTATVIVKPVLSREETKRTQDLEQAMAGAKAEAELVSLRLQLQQLRNFLAGALCTVCGDPLGEEEIIQDDDDQTMHAKCERED